MKVAGVAIGAAVLAAAVGVDGGGEGDVGRVVEVDRRPAGVADVARAAGVGKRRVELDVERLEAVGGVSSPRRGRGRGGRAGRAATRRYSNKARSNGNAKNRVAFCPPAGVGEHPGVVTPLEPQARPAELPDASDADLLRTFGRTRDDLAFGRLVARHAEAVRAVALRATGNAHAAEDVAQATFLVLSGRVGPAMRSAKRRGSVRPWLAKTCRYCAANWRRAEARRRKRERAAAVPEQVDPSRPGELSEAVAAAMSRLGGRDRKLIELHHLDEQPWPRVAAELNLSPDAAKRAGARAMERLRELLPPPGGHHVVGRVARRGGRAGAAAAGERPAVRRRLRSCQRNVAHAQASNRRHDRCRPARRRGFDGRHCRRDGRRRRRHLRRRHRRGTSHRPRHVLADDAAAAPVLRRAGHPAEPHPRRRGRIRGGRRRERRPVDLDRERPAPGGQGVRRARPRGADAGAGRGQAAHRGAGAARRGGRRRAGGIRRGRVPTGLYAARRDGPLQARQHARGRARPGRPLRRLVRRRRPGLLVPTRRPRGDGDCRRAARPRLDPNRDQAARRVADDRGRRRVRRTHRPARRKGSGVGTET